MHQKKIPMRMCTGCGEMKPKRELVRVVKSPEGEVSLDLTGKKPGRGDLQKAAERKAHAVKAGAGSVCVPERGLPQGGAQGAALRAGVFLPDSRRGL